jgi:hypothetical protein
MSQRPRCRICKKLVNDVRFGVCFKCAIQADESRELIDRIESVTAPKYEEDDNAI